MVAWCRVPDDVAASVVKVVAQHKVLQIDDVGDVLAAAS